MIINIHVTTLYLIMDLTEKAYLGLRILIKLMVYLADYATLKYMKSLDEKQNNFMSGV